MMGVTPQLLRVLIVNEHPDWALVAERKTRNTYYINERRFKEWLQG